MGVQFGQKISERVDSSEFKAILAILLLLVGIAIAYDTFFSDVPKRALENEIVNKEIDENIGLNDDSLIDEEITLEDDLQDDDVENIIDIDNEKKDSDN